jgi:hypothetical protein
LWEEKEARRNGKEKKLLIELIAIRIPLMQVGRKEFNTWGSMVGVVIVVVWVPEK